MDTRLFITDRGQSTAEAKRTCERCEVQVACQNYANENNCVGVWGGQHRKLGEALDEARELAPIVYLPSHAPQRVGPSPSRTGEVPASSPVTIAARSANQAQAL